MTTLLDTIVADAKILWGDVVSVEQTVAAKVESGVAILWNIFKGSVGKLASDEALLLNAFVQQALSDVVTGNVIDLETAVLNLAQKAGATFVADLGSPILQAFIAMVQANAAPAAPARA